MKKKIFQRIVDNLRHSMAFYEVNGTAAKREFKIKEAAKHLYARWRENKRNRRRHNERL